MNAPSSTRGAQTAHCDARVVTALKGRAINGFLAAPDRAVRAVLVYGPDGGLVRERAERLAKRVVADLKDPFNAIEFAEADLKAAPERLADEAAQLSFLGGERLIRVRSASEAVAAAAAILVEGLESGAIKANALVVIEAGDLAKTAKLRKIFETAKSAAAALPCYADGPEDVRTLAGEMSAAEGLKFDADALDLTVALLGDDRGVTRAELEKLILYKGPKAVRAGAGVISLEDVRACLSDGVGEALDEAAAAAADGRIAAADAALWKSAVAGASPISLLRAAQRTLARLREAQVLIADGRAPESAMKALRPPVFFGEERAFRARLSNWPLDRLDAALELVLEAELSAKSTGAPQREIAERAFLRLAAMAAR